MRGLAVLLIVFVLTGGNFFAVNVDDGHLASSSIMGKHGYNGECKLVMAAGNATAGDYNLLLKVRDPARPGLQVLCRISSGYEYDYHHPWFPFKMHFVVERSFMGTTTLEDTPPNIIKAGMLMNDAAIAIGDADTISYLTNPTRNAWDDFDWMRYAMQSADTIEEVIELLTEEGVKKLHASSVAENFFVVAPDKAAIVEADAFNYRVKYIHDRMEIQSNYPEMLWDMHLLYPLLTASSFNTTFEGWVKRGDVIKLGGFMGISISSISPSHVMAHLFPFGIKKMIGAGEGEQMGNFYLRVEEIESERARIFVCFNYYEWEHKIENFVDDRMGNITIEDMMMLSRIHAGDIEGLRGMCQGGYEAATIYRISRAYPEFLSSLCFAPDQCASIFVPVHICDMDIYDAYENGEAHSIAMKLLERYGHGNLTSIFKEVERDFINETERVEEEARQLLKEGREDEAIYMLTLADMDMQMKAITIEKAWLNASYLSNELFSRVYPLLKEICRNYDDSSRVVELLESLSSLKENAGKENRMHLENIMGLSECLLTLHKTVS